MAIYSMHVSNVSRSAGSSACASLSYITSERVRDERLGKTYNGFGRRERARDVGTVLPEGAPVEYGVPEELSNSIETHERAANARPAKKIMVALPEEFGLDTQREVVIDFISRNLAADGYAATYAIHCNRDGSNPHAHILVANRQIDPETGGWAKTKARKEYALDADGQRIPVIDPETGQQKLGRRNERMWKRVTVQSNPLDTKEKLQSMREDWAETCNKRLAPDRRIDHRSLKAQGIDRQPTKHEGYAAREIEKRGGISPICAENRDIRRQNDLLDRLKAELESLKERLEQAVARLRARLTAPKPEPVPEPDFGPEDFIEEARERLAQRPQGYHDKLSELDKAANKAWRAYDEAHRDHRGLYDLIHGSKKLGKTWDKLYGLWNGVDWMRGMKRTMAEMQIKRLEPEVNRLVREASPVLDKSEFEARPDEAWTSKHANLLMRDADPELKKLKEASEEARAAWRSYRIPDATQSDIEAEAGRMAREAVRDPQTALRRAEALDGIDGEAKPPKSRAEAMKRLNELKSGKRAEAEAIRRERERAREERERARQERMARPRRRGMSR